MTPALRIFSKLVVFSSLSICSWFSCCFRLLPVETSFGSNMEEITVFFTLRLGRGRHLANVTPTMIGHEEENYSSVNNNNIAISSNQHPDR